MSLAAYRAVWKARLPPHQKYVALALADFADEVGGRIYPGTALLAMGTGLNRRTLERRRAELRKAGVLEVAEPGRGHRHAVYRFSRAFMGTDADAGTVPTSASVAADVTGSAVPTPMTQRTVVGDAQSVMNRHIPKRGERGSRPKEARESRSPGINRETRNQIRNAVENETTQRIAAQYGKGSWQWWSTVEATLTNTPRDAVVQVLAELESERRERARLNGSAEEPGVRRAATDLRANNHAHLPDPNGVKAHK